MQEVVEGIVEEKMGIQRVGWFQLGQVGGVTWEKGEFFSRCAIKIDHFKERYGGVRVEEGVPADKVQEVGMISR